MVLRVQRLPQDAPFTEFLTYGFDNRLLNSATAYLQWENKRVPLRIDVPNVNELYAMQMGRISVRGRVQLSELADRRTVCRREQR